jgi:small subunit ribosomal protein S8
MNISDPIADYLTRIRNAVQAGHDTVLVPYSNLKAEISRILKREGYLRDVEVSGTTPKQVIKITLKYGQDRESVITGLRRVSRPGLRKYVNADDVPRVLGGMGIALLTTSRGILTDREARSSRTGGEVLCQIW